MLSNVPLFWVCIGIAAFDLVLGAVLYSIEPKASAVALIVAGLIALVLAFYWRKYPW